VDESNTANETQVVARTASRVDWLLVITLVAALAGIGQAFWTRAALKETGEAIQTQVRLATAIASQDAILWQIDRCERRTGQEVEGVEALIEQAIKAIREADAQLFDTATSNFTRLNPDCTITVPDWHDLLQFDPESVVTTPTAN
jgi:hypothetical protein